MTQTLVWATLLFGIVTTSCWRERRPDVVYVDRDHHDHDHDHDHERHDEYRR